MPRKLKNDVLTKVLWFDNRIRFDIDYFDLLQPRREVSHHRRYRSGLFRSEKCGRDIQYESALELRFVQQLEANPQVVFFWEQPVQISYWRGRRKVSYTPDFGIYLKRGYIVLAEVKVLADMLDGRVQQKAEALMEYCSKRGFGMLLTDGRHTPRDLMKGRVNRKLERTLLAALGQDTLRQPQIREIMDRCNATQRQLYKAVIRFGLQYHHFPMKLRLGSSENSFIKSIIGKKFVTY